MLEVKEIVCIGAGYVGGLTMSVLANQCHNIKITIVDNDETKLKNWESTPLIIKEPHLDDLVNKCRNINLFFSTDFKTSIEHADLIFLAVETPIKKVGFGAGIVKLQDFIESAVRTIAKFAIKDTIIIEKSDSSPGISRIIQTIFSSNSQAHLQVLSNPDFFDAGTAVADLLNPPRILIGHELTPDGVQAAQILASVYQRWISPEKILTVNLWSSEITKLTENAFLLQRSSSIYTISAICEKTGANVHEVAQAVGLDSRIGDEFLNPSIQFGPSPLQKDVVCLVYIARNLGFNEAAQYWQNVIDIDNWNRERYVKQILHSMFDTLSNKKIAVFGVPSCTIENSLLSMLTAENAQIMIFDPQVSDHQIPQSFDRFENGYDFASDPYECAVDAHALLILTECSVLKTYDYQLIYQSMYKPAFVFDGVNLLDRVSLQQIGFCTYAVGVPSDLN